MSKIPKKESAKRGYMNKYEVAKKASRQVIIPGKYEVPRTLHERISYLQKILKKEKLLNDRTRESTYQNLEDCYKQAIAERPGLANNYLALGKLYEREGRILDAIETYREGNWTSDANRLANQKGLNSKIQETREMQERLGERGYSQARYRSSAAATIIGAVGGMFFLSPSVTGSAVSNMTNATSSFIGAGFLIVGVLGAFFWVQNRKAR